MRIQDVQSDIILSKKLAEYAETVLAQHQEIEQLKKTNAALQQDIDAFRAAEKARDQPVSN